MIPFGLDVNALCQTIATGRNVDFITVTVARSNTNKSTIRSWPWLSINIDDDIDEFEWPVRDQLVVIEPVGLIMEKEVEDKLFDLVDCMRLASAKGAVVICKPTSAWCNFIAKEVIGDDGNPMIEHNTWSFVRFDLSIKRLFEIRQSFTKSKEIKEQEKEWCIDGMDVYYKALSIQDISQ